MTEQPYVEWLRSLRSLTDSADAASIWREKRFDFAYRLGEELAGARGHHPAIQGAAVYGIWLNWGLLYVGQTTEASRRLRDLPVGESHHLSNTFPPEIWDRVVVVDWPSLPESADLSLDVKLVGLALEHRLQRRLKPLANAFRRTSGGGWRPVDWGKSGSQGARAADQVAALAERVDVLWDAAAAYEGDDGFGIHPSVRCVRPVALKS